MSSCTSHGLPLSSGGAALGWEFGHACYQLARGLLAPVHRQAQAWGATLSQQQQQQDATVGPEAGALERIQALALVGIYLANETSREHTFEVLKAAWDTGRSMNAHQSRSVDAYDGRRWDEVDGEMLKRSLWGCFMMLQMVRAASPDDVRRSSDYPRAEDVSQMDLPVHLPPHIESEPALDAWTSELRMDAILASVLDSPLASTPPPPQQQQQAMHDVRLRESWAQELLGQMERWASFAPCYQSKVPSRSIARNFNLRKARSTHQLARSLIRQGLSIAGSMLDIGEDARCDLDTTMAHGHAHEQDASDRVTAWLATTPSHALRAMCGESRGSPVGRWQRPPAPAMGKLM